MCINGDSLSAPLLQNEVLQYLFFLFVTNQIDVLGSKDNPRWWGTLGDWVGIGYCFS